MSKEPLNIVNGVLICEKCNEPMTPEGEIFKTLVGFPSPPGHEHDENCLSQHYHCKNGHAFKVSKRQTCPACDWKGKDSCWCHKGMKVDEWPISPEV